MFVLMLVRRFVVSSVLLFRGRVPSNGVSGFVLLIAVLGATVVLLNGTVVFVWFSVLRAACCASRVCVAFWMRSLCVS